MSDEQPAKPRPTPKTVEQPITLGAYEIADVTALQALNAGTADAQQQQRALKWILEQACQLYDFPFRPGPSDRDTNIQLGRAFAGHQIVKLLKLNVGALRRREPNADPPEG